MSNLTPKGLIRLLDKWGSLRSVARNTEFTYHKVRTVYHEGREQGLISELPKSPVNTAEEHKAQALVEGNVTIKRMPKFKSPKKGIKRYIFTAAQNNTFIHEGFWENLLAFSEYCSANLCVARFYYVKSGLGAKGDKAQITKKDRLYDRKKIEWDDRIFPYLLDERVEVAPGLVWCGEMNILPTADRPLSGLQVYTGRRSGIFPHAKIAMESIPSMLHEPTKFNYTTGAVTVRNYIQRKAGLKAEFHHCYGALLVEVDEDGDWWCRQLNADDDGTFYDLDVKVHNGKVTSGHRVAAINWGDIHVDELDPNIAETAWFGEDNMLEALRPRYQLCHDVLDFSVRSGHHIKRNLPYDRLRAWVRLGHSVEEEIDRMAMFMNQITKPWCDTVIVDSNHHRHFDEWLRLSDWRKDIGENTLFLLEAQYEYASQVINNPDEPVNILEWALNRTEWSPQRLKVLNQDEPFIICDTIECGMHGHAGPNGSRGSPTAFARMGRRANLGHTHVAGIWDGIYYAGTCSKLSLDYNSGPSSWSHSHIVTYDNGKRAIVTMWNKRWRA